VGEQRVTDFEYRPSGSVASVSAKAAELRRLELLVTRRLDGLLSGEFLGVLPGPGTEPAAARAYAAGDDARQIDWNLSARSLEPQVRSTDADRELETWIVVDRSASLDFGTTEREKSEVAFAAAAAFAFLAARHGNRVGLLVAGGDKVPKLGPASTRIATLAALSLLYDTPRRTDPPAKGCDLAGTLLQLERVRARRGQVVIISDFLDAGDWSKALRRVSVRHDIVACQVIDPREMSLPAMGLVQMVDTESGREMSVQTNSSTLRARYEHAAKERNERIVHAVRSAGAEHFMLSTERDWLLDIARFVTRRRGLLRRGARRNAAVGSLR
jgi:uncharacterized protein (DUF58 family)